ncbi:hypothetical protein RB599_003534, partial [Gaeumannomyces hyphopodioides]
MEASPVASGQLPDNGAGQMLYEVRQTTDRGRGLFAIKDIAEGTRIILEKPLLVTSWTQDVEAMEIAVALGLRVMSKEKLRQFLSLHNGDGRKKYPFGGIMRTNALPCGVNGKMGGAYATISLINHSCQPNTHQSWNAEKEHETIHANRPIKAGEELTIAYYLMGTTEARQAHLKAAFGFMCTCPTCSKPEAARAESDERRKFIRDLDYKIGDSSRAKDEPERALADCAALERALYDEFEGRPDQAVLARLYYDAFQVVIAHGDQARAIVFADRAYKARVLAEGEDSPASKKMLPLASLPSVHESFKLYGAQWKSRKTRSPRAWATRISRSGCSSWSS